MADETTGLTEAAEAARGRRIAAEADWGDAADGVRACTARTLSKPALAYLRGRGLGAAFWKGGKLSAEECDEVEAELARMDGPEVARTIKAARRLSDAEAVWWEARMAEGAAVRALEAASPCPCGKDTGEPRVMTKEGIYMHMPCLERLRGIAQSDMFNLVFLGKEISL